MKTGVFSGISFEEYQAFSAANNSGLSLIRRSPAHYWAEYLDPNREKREETPALLLGNAIHTAILEPGKFDDRYVVKPKDFDGRTKEGKELYKRLEATGRKIISFDDELVARGIGKAIRASDAAQILFENAKFEQTVYWINEETGVQCKARFDILGDGIIGDLKSTQDAGKDAFQRSCLTYGYYRQAAWYLDAVRFGMADNIDTFIFAAFEKVSPFACAFYHADAEMIARGRAENRELLRIYARCLKSGEWPGYPGTVSPIGLPGWYLNKAVETAVEEY